MNSTLLQFIIEKYPELIIKIFEQLELVFWSVLIALVIGIPLGIFIRHYPRLKAFSLSSATVLWTIPSLAMLAFLIPFFGIGLKPAVIALALYALLPILRNTVTGLESVSKEVIEAARGLGFTSLQRLWIVELPLAMPIIIAGIRTSVSISVGVATLAAFIGAGGLGDFINQGLALNNTRLILLGAIPAALMALIFDFLIGRVEKSMVVTKRVLQRKKSTWVQKFIYPSIILMIAIFASVWIYNTYYVNRDHAIVIATKNFTESFILGNMMADMIASRTRLQVIKKFNLGSTAICQTALLRGEIDMYPEYTGTAYITVLNQTKIMPPQQTFDYVNGEYQRLFHLSWLPPFGFNNTQALAVREDFAKKYNLKTISNLIPIDNQLIIGVPAEFLERPDGFIGLHRVYDLNFKAVKQMDPGLMYQAIKNDEVNVINAFSTDGRIPAFNLMILEDDKHLYPPYVAAIVIRQSVLDQYPEIYRALQPLFGLIDDKTMAQLNYEADVQHLSPAVIAKNFLLAHHVLAS